MKTRHSTDIVVIGAGLAGLAAAFFAIENGFKTAVVGWTRSELPFASGLLDLLGVHPVESRRRWDDPWAGIAAIAADCPLHPYGRVEPREMKTAWESFIGFLSEAGLPYRGWEDRNAILPTAAGTVKATYRVPETMWAGVLGWEEKRPTLLVDFEGMKDYSALQAVEGLKGRRPGLQALHVAFPAAFPGAERQNLLMAETLESAQVRMALADAVRPHADGFELVGFPAVLGMRSSVQVASHLGEMIGKPVFEIPTLPPSVPGQRLMSCLDEALTRRGASLLLGRRVVRVESEGRRCLGVVVAGAMGDELLEAGGVILATGRFLGGGLAATLHGIEEPLLHLPVHQPASRQEWHREHFLDSRGHPVNRSGLMIDDLFRPNTSEGSPVFENLFAAGSILAHQDWAREKCGAGIAIASSFGAVQGYMRCRS